MKIVQLDADQVFYLKQNIIGIMHNDGVDEPTKVAIIRSLLKLDQKLDLEQSNVNKLDDIDGEDTKYSVEQIHEIIQGKDTWSSCLRLAVSQELVLVFNVLLAAGNGWDGLAKHSSEEFNAILELITSKPEFIEASANGELVLHCMDFSQTLSLAKTRPTSAGSYFSSEAIKLSQAPRCETPDLTQNSNNSSATTSASSSANSSPSKLSVKPPINPFDTDTLLAANKRLYEHMAIVEYGSVDAGHMIEIEKGNKRLKKGVAESKFEDEYEYESKVEDEPKVQDLKDGFDFPHKSKARVRYNTF